MQVLRDLCVMAKANGGVKPAEKVELEKMAKGLGISSSFICQNIESESELD